MSEVAASRPYSPQALNDLGASLAGRGRTDDAIACYRRALALDPDFALALYNLGLALRRRGQLDEALAALRRAVALRPGDADVGSALAAALAAAGQVEAAATQYRRALERAPDHLPALANLGDLLRRTDRLDEARTLLQRAAALGDGAEPLNLLGLACYDGNDLTEAVLCFRRAIARAPHHAGAHVNLAMALLAEGKFEEGLAEYEWRWRGENAVRLPPLAAPLWDGKPLGRGTLLLWAEQGLGDTIQFVRFAPRLRALAGRIELACPPALATLLRGAPGLDAIHAFGEALPPVAAWLPLLSVMHRLGMTADAIPAPCPYLAAEPGRAAALAPLFAGAGLRVGLAWSGNARHLNDRRRSVPLALLRPLLKRPATRCFSLQLGPRAGDPAALGLADRVVELAPHLRDFADTAAAVSRLDLVITVDTAVAHLAGALGRPTFLMLPFSGDWRWAPGRAESPWYPTMRLFRQPRPGAWDAVVTGLMQALDAPLPRTG